MKISILLHKMASDWFILSTAVCNDASELYNKMARGKFMSLFQPLVAGKVLENCGRVFVGCKAPTKIAGIFQNFSAEVNTFWKKGQKKTKCLEKLSL